MHLLFEGSKNTILNTPYLLQCESLEMRRHPSRVASNVPVRFSDKRDSTLEPRWRVDQ